MNELPRIESLENPKVKDTVRLRTRRARTKSGRFLVEGMREITDNAPLRGGKGMLYEGGIRVPLIVSCPEVVAPETLCDVPTSSVDFLPSFCELAGEPIGSDVFCDGESFVRAVQQSR